MGERERERERERKMLEENRSGENNDHLAEPASAAAADGDWSVRIIATDRVYKQAGGVAEDYRRMQHAGITVAAWRVFYAL